MDSEQRIAVLEVQINHLQAEQARRDRQTEKEIGDLREEITKLEARERQREREEKNRLIWGIATLGSVITALGGIIWSYRSVIFK